MRLLSACCPRRRPTGSTAPFADRDNLSDAGEPGENAGRLNLSNDEDPEESESENYLQNSDSLFAALNAGEVVLLSGRWLLERAGYVESHKHIMQHSMQIPWTLQADHANGDLPPPLPNRQQLEAEYPDAIISASAVEKIHRNFLATVHEAVNEFDGRSAHNDGVVAVPILAVSHCWETVDHPDPEGRTLVLIAAGLARYWPRFVAWGLTDVGVFFDWSSMYQSKPNWIRPANCITHI